MGWKEWLTVVEVPALFAIGAVIWRQAAALSDFKVKVAEEYAHKDDVAARLDRLEDKMDRLLDRLPGGHD